MLHPEILHFSSVQLCIHSWTPWSSTSKHSPGWEGQGRESHNKTWRSEPRIQVPSPNAPDIPLQPHIPVHPQINLLFNHHQTFPFLSLACTIPSSLTKYYPYSKISLKTTTFQKKQTPLFREVFFCLLWPGHVNFFLLWIPIPLLTLDPDMGMSYSFENPRASACLWNRDIYYGGILVSAHQWCVWWIVCPACSFKETLTRSSAMLDIVNKSQ